MLGIVGVVGVGVGLRRQPWSLQSGANSFVDDPTQAKADNTPSVAVDPRDPAIIVVGNRVDSPTLGCALSQSTDAGTTWHPLPLTPALGAVNCLWPRVAYLSDGTLDVLYTDLVGISLLPGSVWLQRFDAGSLTPAGDPVQVAGDLAFQARVAAQGNRVWASWVQAGPATANNQLGFAPGSNPIEVARSDDGGRTFGPPVQVSEATRRVIQPSVVVGPGDRVTVGALDLGDDVLDYQASHDGTTPPDPRLRWQVVSWTSTDGGTTFGPTVVVAANLPVPQLIIADLGPTPGFAVDPRNGRLYAAWDAGRGNARDCFVATSTDGGAHWSAPVRLGPTAHSQLLPAIAVAPDGRVDVVFYDRSRDPADHLQDAVVASSTDGGRSFRWRRASDVPSDSRIGLGIQEGVPLQGDNLAVVSRNDSMVAFWADTNRGTLTKDVQDLTVATVAVLPGGGHRWAYAAIGVTFLFAAAALVAVARADR